MHWPSCMPIWTAAHVLLHPSSEQAGYGSRLAIDLTRSVLEGRQLFIMWKGMLQHPKLLCHTFVHTMSKAGSSRTSGTEQLPFDRDGFLPRGTDLIL